MRSNSAKLDRVDKIGERTMKELLLAASVIAICFGSPANAQVELKYADKDGFLDAGAHLCQLAGNQQDADSMVQRLVQWAGKKHFINIPRSREAEHEITS
jgi:hypothetical protein